MSAPRTALELLDLDFIFSQQLAAEFPDLASGTWIHPLTGEEKNFLPPSPGNSGNSPEVVPRPGRTAVSRASETATETGMGPATPVDPEATTADVGDGAGAVASPVSMAVSMPMETGRPGEKAVAVSAVSAENRTEIFSDSSEYEELRV